VDGTMEQAGVTVASCMIGFFELLIFDFLFVVLVKKVKKQKKKTKPELKK
jgi:hypothetical protein